MPSVTTVQIGPAAAAAARPEPPARASVTPAGSAAAAVQDAAVLRIGKPLPEDRRRAGPAPGEVSAPYGPQRGRAGRAGGPHGGRR